MPKAELYVGNLGKDVSRKEIESVFDKYGRLLRCDIKNRGYGSAFAFLEFDEKRDAEDALKSENGKDMCGSSMVIEWAKSRGDKRRSSRDRGRNSGRGGARGGRNSRDIECYECGRRGHIARECRARREAARRDSDKSRQRDRRDRDRDRDRRRDSRRRSRDSSNSRSASKSRSRSRSRSRS